MLRLSRAKWIAFVVAALSVALVTASAAVAHDRDHGLKGHRHHHHHGPGYSVLSLVSDQPGVALHMDPNLVNAWGISASPTSPWWVANNVTNTSTLYDGNGTLFPPGNPLVVGVPGAPTGTVANTGPNFKVSNGTTDVKSSFIFATQSGTIQGWTGGLTTAVTKFTATDGASYTGLAINVDPTTPANDRLYAADLENGKVDMFDGSWSQVVSPGAFQDPYLPFGYRPFGIQNLRGSIFVAYAFVAPGTDDEAHGRGLGLVDEYSTTGAFLHRVGSFGRLNAPWGMAWAPDGFGSASGELLVGNFGDGRINTFVQRPWGQWLTDRQLRDARGKKLSIDGLWGIGFGNGSNSSPTTSLYFAAGPDDETHGLFGVITANP